MNYACQLTLLGLTAASAVQPTPAAACPAANELISILELAGWPPSRIHAIAEKPQLAPEDERQLLQVALRLRQLEALLEEVDSAGSGVAQRVAGRVTAVRRETLAPEEAQRIGASHYYVCRLHLKNGPQDARVVTPTVPQDWLGAEPLDEPIVATGLTIFHPGQIGDETAPLLLAAPRVIWRPEKPDGARINFGESVLGGAAFDVGLLDRVADGAPLLARDSEPFYRMLEAAGGLGAHQLIRFAHGNLPAYAEAWRSSGKRTPLSQAVAEEASGGRYSVAPLFNDAERQRGDLFVFDGVARRVVRVEMGAAAERHGFDHYFELELFTPDSQNLPLVFCVRELPDGFPVGEVIEQEARVAGFFFKRWAYRTRRQAPGDPRSHDKRQLAPLLIGRAPIALAPSPPTGPGAGILAGGAFVLALGVIWWALWRAARRDRVFDEMVRARLAAEDPAEGLATLAERAAD